MPGDSNGAAAETAEDEKLRAAYEQSLVDLETAQTEAEVADAAFLAARDEKTAKLGNLAIAQRAVQAALLTLHPGIIATFNRLNGVAPGAQATEPISFAAETGDEFTQDEPVAAVEPA